MADYYEGDDRPRMVRDLDEIISAAALIRDGLHNLERIRTNLQSDSLRSTHPLHPDEMNRRRAERIPVSEFLLAETEKLLGIISTGSSVAVGENIEHLMSIQDVEESFPGQQG